MEPSNRRRARPPEITEELERPRARKLLNAAPLLRRAYNGSHGFPRVIPIGFYSNGNQTVVCELNETKTVSSLTRRQRQTLLHRLSALVAQLQRLGLGSHMLAWRRQALAASSG